MTSNEFACARLVGRANETRYFAERVRAAADGRGSATILVGNAGIGKSRLLQEVVRDAAAGGAAVFRASCEEGTSTYAPFREIALQAGSDRALAVLDAETNGADSLAARTDRFAGYVRELLATVSPRPVALAIDDLHWADRSTLELFGFAADAAPAAGIMLVGSRRGDDDVDRATLKILHALDRKATRLGLQPLSADEMRAMIYEMMKSAGRALPSTVFEQIVDLVEGHPLHTEEILRTYFDQAHARSKSVEVPRSIRAAVTERLAQLDEPEGLLLGSAAVIGRTFSLAFLCGLTERPRAFVIQTLRRARNLQLITEDEPIDTFRFHHALTREVVYDALLRTEARATHADIANLLVADESSADLTAIAYHAWRSGDLALAARWNERVGDESRRQFAHLEAIVHYGRAFDSTASDDRNRSFLAEKIGSAYYAMGEITESSEWFERAIVAGQTHGLQARVTKLRLTRALALFEGGSTEIGIAAAITAAEGVAEGDRALRFEAATIVGSLLSAVGRCEEAVRYLESVRTLRAEADPTFVARHRSISAQSLARLGELEQSRSEFALAAEEILRLGDLELIVRTLNNWADVEMTHGDLSIARARLDEALAFARQLQSRRLVVWIAQNAAYTALLMGRLDEALAYREIESFRREDVLSVQLWWSAISYRVGTLRGSESLVEQAHIEDAIAHALRLGEPRTIAITAGAAAQRLIARGEPIEDLATRVLPFLSSADDTQWLFDCLSRTGSKKSVAIARELLVRSNDAAQSKVAQAQLLLFDARIAARERRRSTARELAARASQIFRDTGRALDEAYAREVAGHTKDAIALFTRLGATFEIQRLTAQVPSESRVRDTSGLTRREREIANQLRAGLTNRQIAQTLVISERTVETHVAAVMQKLGATRRQDVTTILAHVLP